MGPLGVVEPDPFCDDPVGMEAVDELMQMDGFVFERAPQPLDKDVVHAPAATVHGDRHPGVLEPVRELEAGELAALVGVEDLRSAVGVERRIQSLDAEPRIHGVREPPGQDAAAGPVHDRNQVKEPAPDRDRGDVGTPDLVRPLDRQALEPVWIDPVRGMRGAGPRRPVDCFRSHQAHQPPDTVATGDNPRAAQLAGHLTGAVEWILQKQLVAVPHQRQVLRALALRRIVQRGPADRQYLALTAQAETGNVAAHHRLALRPAHRLSPLAKKSRSTANWPIFA